MIVSQRMSYIILNCWNKLKQYVPQHEVIISITFTINIRGLTDPRCEKWGLLHSHFTSSPPPPLSSRTQNFQMSYFNTSFSSKTYKKSRVRKNLYRVSHKNLAPACGTLTFHCINWKCCNIGYGVNVLYLCWNLKIFIEC